MLWHLKQRKLDLSGRTLVMGILNVTPDSFSNGGRFGTTEAAVTAGLGMVRQGAAILDIGPESTRPGATPVDAREQIRRAIPVIEGIRQRDREVIISVDTRLAQVAVAALEAGADVINDVSALRDDPAMARVAAGTGAGLILMHMAGRPETRFCDAETRAEPRYGDVVEDVQAFLQERIQWAVSGGIDRTRIAVDPGLGFGKNVEQNMELLERVGALAALGRPVVIGASRKRFVGALMDEPDVGKRLDGSLACVRRAVIGGAHVVRVHDVAETVEILRACGMPM